MYLILFQVKFLSCLFFSAANYSFGLLVHISESLKQLFLTSSKMRTAIHDFKVQEDYRLYSVFHLF